MWAEQKYLSGLDDQERLDLLVDSFLNIERKFERAKYQSLITEELSAQHDKFQHDFVTLNCEIQQLRSDSGSLADKLQENEECIKSLDLKIQQRVALMSFIDEHSGPL